MFDTSALYKLPWTREHNANGWIEPTTYCQLKCPFCFRGADLDGHVPEHFPLDAMKREVDELIRLRRLGAITIAGGDPLLYPDLLPLVEYIHSRGVEPMVLTNGIALDETMLARLRDSGAVRVVVHIDKYQKRPGIDSEAAANTLREHFCRLFRKVGGIPLGFIQPIRPDDLSDLDIMIPFFQKNSDVIDLVTFNWLLPLDVRAGADEAYAASKLFAHFRKVYGLEYAAFLPKTHSRNVAWLLAMVVYSGQDKLGSIDGAAFELFQNEHLSRTGKYAYTTRGGARLTRELLLKLPFNRSLRRIAFKQLTRRMNPARWTESNLHLQRILLINTPRPLAGGDLDRCDGCPDAMLHEGRLIPSCWLENVKKGDSVLAG